MTVDGGQGDGVRVSPTELAQTRLILDAVPDVFVHPADWHRSSDGVQYLCRSRSVVVRDWHVPRVQDVLTRRLGVTPQRHALDDVGGTTTRLGWGPRGRRRLFRRPAPSPSVHEAVDAFDAELGPGVAAPDHLLYVCGLHPCAAVEQLPVPATAEPFPSPQKVQDEPAPRSGLGGGVRVLVMDTGLVERAAEEHWWLHGVTGEKDEPFEPGTRTLRQDGGHGTFAAGCVRATAPAAQVHISDSTRDLPLTDGSGMIGAVFESDLARMVRAGLVAAPDAEAAVEAPDILVLNVAGTTRNDVPPLALTALYEDVIQHLKGLLVLAPAGNEGDARKNWPGAFAWVVSVGALDANWRDRAPWSVHGRAVDVYAPGENLVNAYAKGSYTYAWDGPLKGQTRTFDGMAVWSGTSFSTPLVAGLVASQMSATGQSSRRAWDSLLDLAERQAVPGVGPVLYPGQAPAGP